MEHVEHVTNLNDDGHDVLQNQPMGSEEMTDMTDILA